MKRIWVILVMVAWTTSLATPTEAKQVLRFATLAPEGSAWMETMRAIDADVRKATNDEVGFKFYPNMSMGDETDVIRKIRLGQINGGGFTGFGLGEILPEVRVLELPYLFDKESEIDYVVAKLTPRFQTAFAEKGYILLGWADVGWIYFLSQKPVASPRDLEGLKVWMWQGDPLAKAFFDELHKTPVALSVADVRLSLQTGMIDAVYGSPLATLALQWFTKLKHISDIPFTNAIGAVLIDKNTFDKFTPAQQAILLGAASKRLHELVLKSREDNRTAYLRLVKEGLVPVPSSKEQRDEMRAVGLRVQERLVGMLYSRELLNDLQTAIKESKAKSTTK